MAASSSARRFDIGFSLLIGLPGVFRRTRQYVPAVGSELIASAVKMCRGVLGRERLPTRNPANNRGPRPPTRRDGRAALSGFEFGGKPEGGEHLGVPEDRVAADAVLRDREDLQRVQLERAARASVVGCERRL